MDSCKNCNELVSGNYCSNCGQAVKPQKIDRQYIFREIANVFNADKGFFYTTKKLLIAPGKTVRDYIAGNRSRHVKPVPFVFITSLIYTLVNHYLQIGIENIVSQAEVIEGSKSSLMMIWMLENPGYTSLLTGFMMAFLVKLFFRKYGYNLFEIFVLFCFVSGMGSLIFTVITLFQAIIHINLINISTIIGIIYSTWAIGQFFDPKKAGSYIKALLSYILEILILTFLIVFVGTLIDVML